MTATRVYRRPKGWIVIAILAAASVFLAIILHKPGTDMDVVVAKSARLRYRPSLARLSGDFPFREPKPRPRGGSARVTGADALAALAGVVAQLQAQDSQKATTAQLHALGVSYLLAEKPSVAVQTLEDALRRESHGRGDVVEAIRRSTAAALLNDLAAAYQTLMETGDQNVQPLALEAVQRAWTLAQTPQLAWTRAVIIEAYHVREQSIGAWRDYLALETSSRWADEARQRLKEIEKPTDVEVWPSMRDRLVTSRNDESEVFRIVDQYRQEVRLWCEDELLPEWAETVLKGEPSADRLAMIDVLGRALEHTRGEREVASAVEAIRNASPAGVRQLAVGHAAYGAGRQADRRSEAGRALRETAAAIAALTPDLTPFAARARIERAAVLYLANDYTRAREELARLPGDGSLPNTCQGKMHALLGIIALQNGSYEEAAQHYVRAVNAFRRAGERDYEATLLSRLAAALELAGQHAEAQAYRGQALGLLDRSGDPKHRHDAMIEAAYVAIGNDQQAVAELYLDTLVANDKAVRNDVAACTSLMWRSAYKYRRGLLSRAAEDLGDARRVCRSIADPSVRERALANLELAAFTVRAADSAVPSPAGLDSAIAYYNKTNSRVWLRTAYFARARALERDDPGAAERDFRAALDESDTTRARIDERDVRISFTATTDEIVDGYVEFLLRQQREQEAFEVADRSRSRELVDSPTARWRLEASGELIRVIRTELPPDAALVEYRVLRDRTIAWVVAADAFATVSLPVPAGSLDEALAALETGATPLRANATLLYDALLRDVEPLIGSSAKLVIVADDKLERVPFSALHDRVRRRYLVQTRATVVSPSATLFVQSRVRARARAAGGDRVVIVNASSGGTGFAALPEAASETRAIAGLYDDTRIVDSFGQAGSALLGLAADATLLHFAGHTTVPGGRAVRALQLGGPGQSWLEMQDIVSASLPRLRLAYLSACETDSGPILKSEGSVTIGRAFFASGVPVVVATLWPVDDGNARFAALSFHEHLRRGYTPAEALQQAQAALLARHGEESIDWAAFRIIGGGF